MEASAGESGGWPAVDYFAASASSRAMIASRADNFACSTDAIA
jgi:hypothetical protein